MKIVLCGSMSFSQQMFDIAKILEDAGHSVTVPHGVVDYVNDAALRERTSGWGSVEGAHCKIANDLIRDHYASIKAADAVLIVNGDKNGIKNYIGGNTFLEMGFGHVLKKEVYLLNELPTEIPLIYQELIAMQPIILKGDLSCFVPSKVE